MYAHDDVIAAPATAPGEAGVGIIRVSGPGAFEIGSSLFARDSSGELESHRIYHGWIVDPANGERVDEALLLTYRGPSSYTGQDTIELSCHGGMATMRRVLDLCLRCGARMAEPGEFTQRAFLCGHLDLSQAEAVADLVRARTDAQQRLALRQLEGSLSVRVGAAADRIFGLLAHLEATIDFSDEIGDGDYEAALDEVGVVLAQVEGLSRNARVGRVLRDGLRVAVVGRPNVGKSSLLNAIVGYDRAIVTPMPGTTRDVVEETVELGGVLVTLCDTAGMRWATDLVEAIGVERTARAIAEADLALFVFSADEGLTQEDRSAWAELCDRPMIVVANKADLLTGCPCPTEWLRAMGLSGTDACLVSALRGDGLDGLLAAIQTFAMEDAMPASVVVSNARHADALRSAGESLRHAADTLRAGMPADLVSVDLRAALDAFGQISGATVTEDIVERIFSEFCIGK